jgi:hypothetical protein
VKLAPLSPLAVIGLVVEGFFGVWCGGVRVRARIKDRGVAWEMIG